MLLIHLVFLLLLLNLTIMQYKVNDEHYNAPLFMLVLLMRMNLCVDH
jgi:hypothetical protein